MAIFKAEDDAMTWRGFERPAGTPPETLLILLDRKDMCHKLGTRHEPAHPVAIKFPKHKGSTLSGFRRFG